MGAVLARFVIRLTEETTSCQPTDGPRLGTALTDLAAVLFFHLLEAGDCLSSVTHRRTLTLRIQAFIREHLHHPHLTPGSPIPPAGRVFRGSGFAYPDGGLQMGDQWEMIYAVVCTQMRFHARNCWKTTGR
ncbi:hypothetical protein [Streptomyces sp. NPDC017993]|uniref:hypothetical protein n=1 Tax=Streptomyces sp. NPDC017993 TaxID=3365027 RepID=UPI003797B073